MISFGGSRAAATKAKMDKIKVIDWGLLILDEVQMVPAKTFRMVTSTIRSHCKLGLTATLVKENA